MNEYREGVPATVKQYGGKYRVAGGECEQIEGDWSPSFPVLIEFLSLAEAHAWYESDEYTPLLKLRLAVAHAVFMEAGLRDFVK